MHIDILIRNYKTIKVWIKKIKKKLKDTNNKKLRLITKKLSSCYISNSSSIILNFLYYDDIFLFFGLKVIVCI